MQYVYIALEGQLKYQSAYIISNTFQFQYALLLAQIIIDVPQQTPARVEEARTELVLVISIVTAMNAVSVNIN